MRPQHRSHAVLAGGILVATLGAPALSAEPLGEPGPSSPIQSEPPRGDESQPRTLFAGKVDHGGFGAPAVKITSVNGQAAVMPGVQGGWIVAHSLVLGIAGYGLASLQDAPAEMRVQGTPSTLEMGYGGFRMGYLLMPASVAHVGFGLLLGGGGVAALSKGNLPGVDEGVTEYRRRTANTDAFFVMEPEVEAEVNVTRFMRLAVAGSYRLVAGIQVAGLENSRIGGPAAGLALRFGSF